MAQEIERKFLVEVDRLPGLDGVPSARLVQGYLAFSPSVRVRIADEGSATARAWLTIKGPGLVSRAEYEYEIPPTDARELLGLAQAWLEKTRYRVDHQGTHFELDQFVGAHQGLWLAEVELPTPDAPFARPPWLGHEVSGDPGYSNSALARAAKRP